MHVLRVGCAVLRMLRHPAELVDVAGGACGVGHGAHRRVLHGIHDKHVKEVFEVVRANLQNQAHTSLNPPFCAQVKATRAT
jgi:hypothetical protein